MVRVTPRSSRNQIKIDSNDQVRAYVTSAPVEGEANQAVIQLLSKALDVSKSSITIASGLTSRDKGFVFSSLSSDDAFQILKHKFSDPKLPGF